MAYIALTNSNNLAIVDDEDLDRLSEFKWHRGQTSIRRSEWVRYTTKAGFIKAKTKDTPLANEVMQKYGVMYDHKDSNFFNCSKQNLRECNYKQNNQNRSKMLFTTSKYKGVYRDKCTGRWAAQIRVNGEKFFLGLSSTQKEAALAYNIMACIAFGEFAKLNRFDI